LSGVKISSSRLSSVIFCLTNLPVDAPCAIYARAQNGKL
jgi:hypothetical protein